MLDHQVGQTRAVDQDHALAQVPREVDRGLAERRGGHEDTLGGVDADEAIAGYSDHLIPRDPGTATALAKRTLHVIDRVREPQLREFCSDMWNQEIIGTLAPHRTGYT